MHTIIRAGAAAAALFSLPLSAAEGPVPLGDTIVTATRTETELDEVLAPVIVITRDELERSLAPDIASLLQFHAGLDIGRNGGPGQVTSVFIRGTDSNHATVLVDGVRINPGTIGGAQIQNIAPEAIERIEIVKGPRSSLYGTDAIGGVINIITRDYSANGLETTAEYGRYDTRQASLGAGFGGERGGLSLSGVWLKTDGFPARAASAIDSGFENGTVSLKAHAQFGASHLGARVWRAEGTTDYLNFSLAPVSQDFMNQSAALDVAFQPATAWDARVTLSRIEDDIQQNQPDPFSGAFDFLQTRRNSLDWQNDVRIGASQLVTAGLLLSREETESLSFGTAFDEDTDVDMVFLQDRIDVGPHNLLLAGAYTDHDTFGGEPTWNVEYGFDFTSGTRLVAAAGTAFRAPDSTDRFGFGGNPDLDPESSRNFELSLQQRIGARQRLRLSAFRNDIDDLILFVLIDPATFEFQNQNIERARIEGVELAYEFEAASWRLRAEAIAQNPRNLTTDTQLLRRAKESLTVSLAKTFGAHEVGIDALVTGEREDFGFPEPTELDGYALINLYARIAIVRGLSIQARLENALDEQYELASTYNTPDRSLFVAARYEFR